ncbi:MAG: hypothetical protein P4L64_01335 [Caulobacteraceae bacterium]|nr:hypothetical protein [Caulobacteraceae bacterium]
MTALTSRFPASLDELQHLSFIRWSEADPRLLPRYQDLRVLEGNDHVFTSAPNYLNHPAPYYLLMGLVDRALGGSVLGLRLVNLGLSLSALALLLVVGFRLLQGWRERAVFAFALVLFPKLGVVGGLINNDNGALLAVAVGCLGLVAWQRRPTFGAALLLAIGLALCGWTKFTVLLMIVSAAAVAEVLRYWKSRERPEFGAILVLGAGLLIAAIPSVANLATYGRVLHHTAAFYVNPIDRAPLGFGGYAQAFFLAMAQKWAALEPSNAAQVLGLCVVIGLAGAAVMTGVRQIGGPGGNAPSSNPAWRVAIGLILATAPVLAMHLYFGWRTFVEDGFIEMAQVRYYYGVWPGFALGLALLWRSQEDTRLRLWVTTITAVLLATASISFAVLMLAVRGRGLTG